LSSIENSSILAGLGIYVFVHKVSSGIRRRAVVVRFKYIRDVRLHSTDERVGFVAKLILGCHLIDTFVIYRSFQAPFFALVNLVRPYLMSLQISFAVFESDHSGVHENPNGKQIYGPPSGERVFVLG
jgi:hypothetical protein